MVKRILTGGVGLVALLAEGVDRNLTNDKIATLQSGRPPRGGRG